MYENFSAKIKYNLNFLDYVFDNDFIVALPELFLLLAITILLFYGLYFGSNMTPNKNLDLSGGSHYVRSTLSRKQSALFVQPAWLTENLCWLSIICLVFTSLLLINNPVNSIIFYNNLIYDDFACFFKVLLIFSSSCAILIGLTYVKKIHTFESILLLLLSIFGMLACISSYNLLALYLAIELQSLCSYVLAASKRRSEFSTEAGLKYFILGAFSSALLLFGISLVYGFTGTIQFNELWLLMAQKDLYAGCYLGLIFIAISFLFKISAVPFHMWSPDVYEGAPTSITAFFALTTKISVLGVFLRLFVETTVLPTWITKGQQLSPNTNVANQSDVGDCAARNLRDLGSLNLGDFAKLNLGDFGSLNLRGDLASHDHLFSSQVSEPTRLSDLKPMSEANFPTQYGGFRFAQSTGGLREAQSNVDTFCAFPSPAPQLIQNSETSHITSNLFLPVGELGEFRCAHSGEFFGGLRSAQSFDQSASPNGFNSIPNLGDLALLDRTDVASLNITQNPASFFDIGLGNSLGLGDLAFLDRLDHIQSHDFILFYLFAASSVASMVLGSLAALSQSKIKRLLAFSSIANVGYLLIGLCCASVEGISALLVHLGIYVVMTINIFAIILIPIQREIIESLARVKYISDLGILVKTNPLLSLTFAISLFSLAGIPPLAGFIGKYYLLVAAVNSAHYVLALIAVLTTVISSVYYIRLVKIMYFEPIRSTIITNSAKRNPNNRLTTSSILSSELSRKQMREAQFPTMRTVDIKTSFFSFSRVSWPAAHVLGLTFLLIIILFFFPKAFSIVCHYAALNLTY